MNSTLRVDTFGSLSRGLSYKVHPKVEPSHTTLPATYMRRSLRRLSRWHFAALFLCAVTTVARAVSPPVIGGVPNQVIVLNANTGTLYFEIGDPASATLTVAATSGNTTLVPNSAANLTLGGATAQRTIRVTPAAGLTGTAAITLTVTNASSLTASTTFNLTVTAPNTPPTIAGLPSYQIVSPGQTPAALNFTVGDAETAAASLNVAATSSNTNLVPIANITLGGSGANRTVQITPVAGRAGAAMIKLNVTDAAGASAQGEFIFSVFQPASANNALKQPHGIYILDSSAGTIINGVSMRDGNVRDLPFIDGYSLRVNWSELEPASGTFDFTMIANIFAKLPANQKLSIILLSNSPPAWLLATPGITTWTAAGVTWPLPWDAIAQEQFRQLLVALGNFTVDGVPLRNHPRLASVNLGITGVNNAIRDPSQIHIRDMPGYSRPVMQGAVLTYLANTTDNFPTVHAGLFTYVDNQDASYGGVTAWEQLRQAILAQQNGITRPRIGFYQDNVASTRPAVNTGPITGLPNTTFAAPLYLSANNAYTAFQALAPWSVPFDYTLTAKVINSGPGDGLDYIFNTFQCRYCECYVNDVTFANNTTDLQHWHDFFNALPVAATFAAATTVNTNGTVTLNWPTIIGDAYQVQYSGDLVTWTLIGTPAVASTGTMTWTDDGTQTGTPPSNATKRFYRIAVTPQ